jgi:hypothetical protein
MGVEAEVMQKMVARVLCQGDCDQAIDKYRYRGIARIVLLPPCWQTDKKDAVMVAWVWVPVNEFVHLMPFM